MPKFKYRFIITLVQYLTTYKHWNYSINMDLTH